jgi:hypothetical protein
MQRLALRPLAARPVLNVRPAPPAQVAVPARHASAGSVEKLKLQPLGHDLDALDLLIK